MKNLKYKLSTNIATAEKRRNEIMRKQNWSMVVIIALALIISVSNVVIVAASHPREACLQVDGQTSYEIFHETCLLRQASSDRFVSQISLSSTGYKFKLGDRVQATANLNVREGPGLSYPIIKTETMGSTGVVVCSKPQSGDGYVWWVIRYADGIRGWSAENWLEKIGAISIITNLPMTYIHQCYDTRDDFDGRWACGATSAVMVLAYHGKIEPWPYTCSYPYPHISDYGNYISQKYTSPLGYTFDTITTDASGNPAMGAYGYIHYPDGLAKLDKMVDYFQKHGLDSEGKYNPSESYVKAELDSGYPVPASTELTSVGHWVVIKGYADGGYYVVNDPNGCKPYKGDTVWGLGFNYCGENVLYTWEEMKVNEKWIAKVHPRTVYTITFYTDPLDKGSITFAGTTYTNGQTGQYAGGSYTVTANAPSGYVFSNWVTTGGVTISGSTATVSGAGTIKAVFTQVKYTITFYTDPSTVGSITFAGTTYTHGQSGQYAAGTYTVTANAPSGWQFSSWATTGGVTISGSTATVTSAGTIKAVFTQILHTITFYTNPIVGSITFSGTTYTHGQTGSYVAGSYTAMANPPTNYAFHHWEYGGGVYVPNININPTTVQVSGDGWLKAVFSAKITFHTNPSGVGSITYDGQTFTDGQYMWEPNLPPDYGNTKSIQANTPSGYTFNGWTATGSIIVSNPSNPTTTLTVNGPGDLTANFIVTKYTITFYTDPSDKGSITFAGTTYTNGQSGQYAAGSYSVTANPPSGYVFSNWVTTGGVSISGSTATVTGSGTIKAVFTQIEYTVTFYTDPSDKGSITFAGATYTNGQTGQYAAGSYPVSANAPSGWQFSSWATTGGVTISGSTATVAGSGTIKAVFTEIVSFRIWTDKTTYKIGETMKVYVRVKNLGPPLPVRALIYLKLPSGALYGPLLNMTTTIPSGYDSGNYLWQTFTIPNAPLGNYQWVAQLKNPSTGALITQSTWDWSLAATAMETPSVEAVLQANPNRIRFVSVFYSRERLV